MKKILYGLVVIAIFLISFSMFKTLYINIVNSNKLSKQYEELNLKYKKYNDDLSKLLKDDNFQKYYREKYNLSKKGEVLFKFPEEKKWNY